MVVPGRLFEETDQASLARLETCIAQATQKESVPLASSIEKKVPIYDGAGLRQWLVEGGSDSALANAEQLMDEWHACLGENGPGVFVVRDMVPQDTVEAANRVLLDDILESERREKESQGRAGGDHFAKAGANGRIWNALEKMAIAAPDVFARYYANQLIDLACQAWLGPGYQMTSQVNVVYPGGQAQSPHRDYHLGFQSASAAARYPKATHLASQRLTLQAAVAHSDMSLASGPTLLLPFSHQLPEGYLAYRQADVRRTAESAFVQVALKRGDGLFFNPALIHAAGNNITSDVVRTANLLQISSPFGKPMELVDTRQMIRAVYAPARALYEKSQLKQSSENGLSQEAEEKRERSKVTVAEVKALVRATASGYAFPANLDRTAPKPDGSMATTEQDVLWDALQAGHSQTQLEEALKSLS